MSDGLMCGGTGNGTRTLSPIALTALNAASAAAVAAGRGASVRWLECFTTGLLRIAPDHVRDFVSSSSGTDAAAFGSTFNCGQTKAPRFREGL
jgi:hypothetical protein